MLRPALNEGRPGGAGNPPATPPPLTEPGWFAQRRPAWWGRQPRRPGAALPADSPPLNEGRPGGAGNPTRRLRACGTRHRPLNEGRPGGAGNPRCGAGISGRARLRSTKAGLVGPATPVRRDSGTAKMGMALNEGRPGGAGNPRGKWTPSPVRALSTLNEGRPGGAGNPTNDPTAPQRRSRSTKAGLVGPATQGCRPNGRSSVPYAQRRPAWWGRQPSQSISGLGALSAHAQRRPAWWGRQPQPPPFLLGATLGLPRSTKAGLVGPATLPHINYWGIAPHGQHRRTRKRHGEATIASPMGFSSQGSLEVRRPL